MHNKLMANLLTGFFICAGLSFYHIFFSTAASKAAEEAHSSVINLADVHGLKALEKFERKIDNHEAPGLRCYEFSLDVQGESARVVVLHYAPAFASEHLRLSARLAARTEPTSRQASENQALAAVNGGYFNLSDGKSASYVFRDGVCLADPKTNQALVQNPRLKKFLPAIFNRSELRILTDAKNQIHYSIAAHQDPLPAGMQLVDSLQGGPRLLPTSGAEAEAFLRREPDGSESDSIGVKRKAARTAIGLCDGGAFLIVSVAGPKQDEFSQGLSIDSLTQLLSQLGAREALNFDGGTSATLVLKETLLKSPQSYQMLVGREPETRVKSTLCLIEQK